MQGRILAIAAAAAAAGPVWGGDYPLEINNIYFLEQEMYQLRDRVYFTQDNRGSFEVIQGPFENGPARCIGAGFGFQDGRADIDGICIFGEGDDTFTMEWHVNPEGMRNDWEIVDGTGRYAGMTGTGIATTDVQVMYHAMPLRQTHIIGTVTLPGE